MNILLYLILAHLVADFILQSDKLVQDKNEYYKMNNKYLSKRNPLLIHGILVLLSMQILHFFYNSCLLIILMSIIITIVHVIIDHVKLYLSYVKGKKGILYFSMDQVLHVLMIYIISSFFKLSYTQKYIWLFGSYKSKINKGIIKIPYVDESTIGSAVLLIIFSIVAGHIISFILKKFTIINSNKCNVDELVESSIIDEENIINKAQEQIAVSNDQPSIIRTTDKNIGIKIGIIERLLVIIFVVTGEYSAMGLILAGKSLARFEDLKDKGFSEYYLLGTLLSFLFGITGGILIKMLIN